MIDVSLICIVIGLSMLYMGEIYDKSTIRKFKYIAPVVSYIAILIIITRLFHSH